MNPKLLKLALAVSVALYSQMIFAAENKVALVIGNGVYKDKNLNLKNPVNDAKDMKAALEKVGFKVTYMENATFDQMDAVREEFVKMLDSQSLTLFYYSGHGVQADGINYLIPSDAKITSKADLKRRAYDLGYFLDDMGETENRANIIILDACRNNPFKAIRTIGNSKGLTAPTEAPKGSIIAYATSPNSVASDNPAERNGMYTKYLKEYLFKPGLKIEDALKEVRRAVSKETDKEQTPWENSSLIGDVCLAGCGEDSVVKTNYAPLLSFVSGANTVNQNKSYTVKFKATDENGDLSKILVDWGDGSAITSKSAKNSANVSFSHTYKFAGIYDLIATAIDKQNAESETFSKELEVKEVSAPVVEKPTPAPVVTVKIPDLLNINALPSSIVLGSQITFNAKLSATLPSGYKVKVNYNGEFVEMSGSGTSFSLSVKPTDLGASIFIVGIYDSKNNSVSEPQLKGNFSVSEPAPVVIETPKPVEPKPTTTTKGDVETFVSGDKTFSYTKIANDGSELPKTAKLGTGAKDWACTKDNNTGLIWEVKTTDDGLRDWQRTYTNYDEIYPKCDDNTWGEGFCKNNGFTGKLGDSTNTDAFVKAVNKQGLCGAKDWRMPKAEELSQLLLCLDGKYSTYTGYGVTDIIYCPNSVTYPTINTTYFPNTESALLFWSSSPYANSSDNAWVVNFGSGNSGWNGKDGSLYVRLVRG